MEIQGQNDFASHDLQKPKIKDQGLVLVVEDEEEIRDLIALQVRRAGFQVITMPNGEMALPLLKSTKFDLIILDWMLPDFSGIDLVDIARSESVNRQSAILMVTARVEPSDIVLGLEHGADDYLTKPFEIPVLTARIKALTRRLSRQSDPENEHLTLGSLQIDTKRIKVTRQGEELLLTPSEFKLLKTLAENNGRVLARDQLIQQVQGQGVSVVGRTIDTHIFGLRKKLGADGDLIETVRGIGYRVRS